MRFKIGCEFCDYKCWARNAENSSRPLEIVPYWFLLTQIKTCRDTICSLKQPFLEESQTSGNSGNGILTFALNKYFQPLWQDCWELYTDHYTTQRFLSVHIYSSIDFKNLLFFSYELKVSHCRHVCKFYHIDNVSYQTFRLRWYNRNFGTILDSKQKRIDMDWLPLTYSSHLSRDIQKLAWR